MAQRKLAKAQRYGLLGCDFVKSFLEDIYECTESDLEKGNSYIHMHAAGSPCMYSIQLISVAFEHSIIGKFMLWKMWCFALHAVYGPYKPCIHFPHTHHAMFKCS